MEIAAKKYSFVTIFNYQLLKMHEPSKNQKITSLLQEIRECLTNVSLLINKIKIIVF